MEDLMTRAREMAWNLADGGRCVAVPAYSGDPTGGTMTISRDMMATLGSLLNDLQSELEAMLYGPSILQNTLVRNLGRRVIELEDENKRLQEKLDEWKHHGEPVVVREEDDG